MKTSKKINESENSSLNNEFGMHAATQAGSVLFAPSPCAKGTCNGQVVYNRLYVHFFKSESDL